MVWVKIDSHLSFVDDIFLVGLASRKTFRALKCILEEFSLFSNLEINHQKNFIVISKQVTGENEMVKILGFQIGQSSIRHLGVPIIGRSNAHSNCDYLIVDL